jgi:hypothetical protein
LHGRIGLRVAAGVLGNALLAPVDLQVQVDPVQVQLLQTQAQVTG